MTESAQRTPPPDPASDAELEHESSTVRERVSPTPRPETSRPARSKSGELTAYRPSYVDEMVRSAKILLADLPADHPRARLLGVAMIRRDEVLLETILAELQDERQRLASGRSSPRRSEPPDR